MSLRLLARPSTLALRSLKPAQLASAAARRAFASSPASMSPTSLPKPNTNVPENKMVYLPGMTTDLPSRTANFRTVLFTGRYSQVVLMTIPPEGEIGEEIHTVDQILTFTSGVGKAIVGGETQDVKAGDMVVVPAGTTHNFVNAGPNPLVLNTVYAPAEHNPTTVHKTKAEADEHEDDGTDEPPAWSQKSKAENDIKAE